MARVVNYTLQPVTASDCDGVSVSRQSNGSGGFVLVVTYSFGIRDEGGVVRERGSVSHQLSAGVQTTMATFITNNGVPLFNTANAL